MGIGGISIWNLLIILGIVVLLFGTKKLSSIGTDLGSALKGFRNAMRDEDEAEGTASSANRANRESSEAIGSNQASGAAQAGSTAERSNATEDRLQ